MIIPAIGLDLGQTKVSVECAWRWLKKLGYALTEAKKAMYVDGHERPDVVAYRKEFLKMMKSCEQCIPLPFPIQSIRDAIHSQF